MKALFVTALFVILGLIISCDESATNNDNNLYGIISGKVLNKDLIGIESVEIYTVPATEVILSKTNGIFTFDKVPIGTYQIFAKKNGYILKSITIQVLANAKTDATIILDNENPNQNPSKPILTIPANNAKISYLPNLQWNCTDPDNDKIFYDVYLDESTNPTTLIANHIENSSFNLKDLVSGKKYYWKVIALDSKGGNAESDIWSFEYTKTNLDIYKIFDLDFDKVISDKSDLKQNCIPSNVFLIKDRKGNESGAGSFDGNSYIEVFNPKSMNFDNPFTISVWVKPSAEYGNLYEGEGEIISRYGATTSGTSSFALYLKYGKLVSEIFHPYQGRNILNTNIIVYSEIWTHICFVYDGSSLLLYSNGNLVGKINTYQPDSSNLSLFIGKRSLNNRYYKGAIDDIQIFNIPLSSNDILELYEQ